MADGRAEGVSLSMVSWQFWTSGMVASYKHSKTGFAKNYKGAQVCRLVT